MQKRFQIYDKVEHKIKGAYYKLIWSKNIINLPKP
jgi:hypothetical protein